jgi:hypothetical protein
MLHTKEHTALEIFEALKISPTLDGNFVLLEDFRIDGYVIQKGYKTNGANVPRMFWSFIPPFKVQNLPAVVVHDWLCDKEKYVEADKLFEILLNKFDLEPLKDEMVFAVKKYHKFKYKI